MARLPRLSIGGELHVVVQRTRDARPVFDEPVARRDYLDSLRDAAAALGVAIHGYGLGAAEVRWLVTPPDDTSLGRMAQHIGRRFAARLNRASGQRGALWDGRFRCTIVDATEHFVPSLIYVEHGESATDGARPTTGAGAAPQAPGVPTGSADHHAGVRRDVLITEHPQYWLLGNTPFERDAAYQRALQSADMAARVRDVAGAAQAGWALGSPAFIARLDARGTRRATPRRPGRPRKARAAGE